MSTPAWSSLPPMPMPSRVATYVAAGPVELARAGAVADLPDRRTARPGGGGGAALSGARDRVVGVRERARDLALVHVGGAQLDVAAVRLQPLVVLGRDAVAEHVHRLWLAAEVRGQLLGDEHVGAVGDLAARRRSCRGR